MSPINPLAAPANATYRWRPYCCPLHLFVGMQGQGTQGVARARIFRTVCCVLREARTVCCVLRAVPQGRAVGAAPAKRDRRQAARGSAARGEHDARSASTRCALDVYRLREGARLLAER